MDSFEMDDSLSTSKSARESADKLTILSAALNSAEDRIKRLEETVRKLDNAAQKFATWGEKVNARVMQVAEDLLPGNCPKCGKEKLPIRYDWHWYVCVYCIGDKRQ